MTTSIQETTFIGKSFDIDLPSIDNSTILISSSNAIGILNTAKDHFSIYHSLGLEPVIAVPSSDRITRISSYGDATGHMYDIAFPRREELQESTKSSTLTRNRRGALSVSEYITQLRENTITPPIPPDEETTLNIDNSTNRFIEIQNVDFAFSSNAFIGYHTKDNRVFLHHIIDREQRVTEILKNININRVTEKQQRVLESDHIASTMNAIYILDAFNNLYIIFDSLEESNMMKVQLPKAYYGSRLIISHEDVFVIHGNNQITFLDIQREQNRIIYRDIYTLSYFLSPSLYSFFIPRAPSQRQNRNVKNIIQRISNSIEYGKDIVILYSNNTLELLGTNNPSGIPRRHVENIYVMRDTFFVMDHHHTMYIWDNSQTLVTIENVENIAQSHDIFAFYTKDKHFYMGNTRKDFEAPDKSIVFDRILLLQDMLHSIIFISESDVSSNIIHRNDMSSLFFCETGKDTLSRLISRSRPLRYCRDVPKKLRYIHRPNETLSTKRRFTWLNRNTTIFR